MLTAAVATPQEFERRIRSWLSYSDAEITGIIQRAREADALVKSSGLFDYTLVNKQLEMTTEKLQDLISENRPDLIPPRSEVMMRQETISTSASPPSALYHPHVLPSADNHVLLLLTRRRTPRGCRTWLSPEPAAGATRRSWLGWSRTCPTRCDMAALSQNPADPLSNPFMASCLSDPQMRTRSPPIR